MNPPPKQPRGLFASSMDELDRKNPVSFSLPDPVKTYFQGVQAGPNGEYMEQQDTKPTK